VSEEYKNASTYASHMFTEQTDDGQLRPTHVYIDEPPIGNKIFLIKQYGTYVLERSPTMWRSMACTHAGSGAGVTVYDGIPDEDGFFQKDVREIVVLPPNPTKEDLEAHNNKVKLMQQQELWNYNGREVYFANPACMGMWMFDGGTPRGLTIRVVGAVTATSPYITLTWVKLKEKPPAKDK
jgi:hypothetical protein